MLERFNRPMGSVSELEVAYSEHAERLRARLLEAPPAFVALGLDCTRVLTAPKAARLVWQVGSTGWSRWALVPDVATSPGHSRWHYFKMTATGTDPGVCFRWAVSLLARSLAR